RLNCLIVTTNCIFGLIHGFEQNARNDEHYAESVIDGAQVRASGSVFIPNQFETVFYMFWFCPLRCQPAFSTCLLCFGIILCPVNCKPDIIPALCGTLAATELFKNE